VRFSEPLDRASFGPEALTVTNPLGVQVIGTLTLNKAATEASFLPTNPLEHAATYTVELAATIRDRQGLEIEGNRAFSFSVIPFFERPAGAQLVIYEPGADNVPEAVRSLLVGYSSAEGSSHVVAHGSPGTADPEVAVILVNQNTGATATVLSKPDGSFANFIDAEEEDFIEAVFVNANGTRVTVPATRQIYDNGRIGLYKYGGILEAENDEAGQVQVLIAPEAIPNRTVFKLDLVNAQTLFQLLTENPPEAGTAVGAFRYQITEGEDLSKPPEVIFAASVQQLGLQPDDDPNDHAFALCESASEGGIQYYKIIDRMKYENGRLITSSPPFLGPPGAAAASSFLLLPFRMALGYKFTAAGRVLLGKQSELPAGNRISNDEGNKAKLKNGGALIPVPGALVFGSVGGFNDVTNRLRPGAFAAKANSKGFYATVVPYNPLEPDVVMLTCTHPALPNLRATNGVVPDVQDSLALPVSSCHLVFGVPDAFVGDFTPPSIFAEVGQATLPVGEDFVIKVRIEDSVSEVVLREAGFDPIQSRADNPATLLNSASVQLEVLGQERPEKGKMEVRIRVRAFEPMLAAIKFVAADELSNERTRVVLLRFGNLPEPEDELAIVDSEDTLPPRLVGSIPAVGGVFSGTQLSLFFNEAISRRCLDADAIGIRGAKIASKRLTQNQRTLILNFAEIDSPVLPENDLSRSNELVIELNPSFFTDLAENVLEGDNLLTFRTLPLSVVDLTETTGAMAVTLSGNHVVTLRNLGNGGELVIHPPGATGSTPAVGRIGVPVFPRAMVHMPAVTFFEPDASPPPFTLLAPSQNPLNLSGRVRTADLVAVVGGVTGEDQVGPWLWLIDVSDPAHPVRLASSLVTADFTTAVSMLKWSPPRLGLGAFTPEGGQIKMVNVQAFIIGSKGYSATQYAFGLDLNFDGDFVDAGERCPVPRSRTLFGFEDVAFAPAQLSFNDFAMMNGGAQLLGVTRSSGSRPPQLHVLRWPGVDLDAGEGVADLPEATYRVMLDPAFPLEDETGIRTIPAAILAGGNRLLVVSLDDPENPAIVRNREVLPPGSTLFFLGETNRAELVVAGTDGLRTLSRLALGRLTEDPFVTFLAPPLFLSGGRSVGVSELELTSYSSSTGTRVLRREPRIRVIQLRDPPLPGVAEIRLRPPDEKGRLIESGGESGFLRPVFPGGEAGEGGGLNPSNTSGHHFVHVRASGTFGPTILVGAQSLRQSELVTTTEKCSFLVTDRSPEVVHMRAHRMSSDPQSMLYNDYVAGPFVLVRQPLSPDETVELNVMDGRKALWSGDFTRAFLAADPGADGGLLPYLAVESGNNVNPGVAATYRSYRAEYVDSPNPSPGAAPRAMGGLVNLQSGELTVSETDLALEGRHQDVVFQRVYQSQSYYVGPLGRNWDHNFNARIQEVPEGDFPESFSAQMLDRGFAVDTMRAGDVVMIDGAGATLLFSKISERNGNNDSLAGYENDPALNEFWGANGRSKIRTFYESPESVFSFLVQLHDFKWVLIGVNGTRLYFNSDGSLDRLVGERAASVLTCHYRPRDGLLGEVRGDNGSVLRFGYYYPPLDPRRTGPVDPTTPSAAACGRLARLHGQLSEGPGGPRVEFEYDEFGNLESVTPSWRRPIRYGYDEGNPALMVRFGADDSGTYPEATVSYLSGMVKSISSGGEVLQVGGSLRSAKERFEAGNSKVTFGVQDGTGAEYDVNERGHPTKFGGREMGVAPEGMLDRFQTVNADVIFVHDRTNPVRRFRGNLLRTERRSIRGGPARVSTTEYGGDAMNRPIKITNIDGVTTEFEYLQGEVREVTGESTSQTLVNTFGQPTAETQTGGPVPLQVQHSLDVVTGLSDGLVASTEAKFERDDLGRVTIQRKGESGFIHRFDPRSGLASEIVARKPTEEPSLSWSYDGQGRIETESLEGGGVLVRHLNRYDDLNHPGQVTEEKLVEPGLPEMVTTREYDEFGRTTVCRVDGLAAVYGYEGTVLTSIESPTITRALELGVGSRVDSVTENGVTTSFEYDDAERVKKVFTGGRLVETEFLPGIDGAITERVRRRIISAPNDAQTPALTETLTYDGGGQVSAIESSTGRIRTFEYHSDGSPFRNFINGFVTQQIDLDQNGRVTAVKLGNLNRQIMGHDPSHGRPLTEILTWTDSGRSMPLSHRYDGSGRRLGTTYPAGEYSRTFDVFGNLTSRTDPDSVMSSFVASPLGTPQSAVFADGSLTSYVSGPGRRLERVESVIGSQVLSYGDAEGEPGYGLLKRMDNPDGTHTAFSLFNEFKKPEKVSQGTVEKVLEYDELGRLTGVTSTFDETDWSLQFDGRDRLRTIALGDEEVETVYTPFDSFGGEVYRREGVELGRWSLERDVRDRIMAEVYPSGLRIEYAPDPFGQATQMSATGIEGVEWLGLGTPSEIRHSSGLVVRWNHDASFRMNQVEYVAAGEVVAGYAYEHSPGGRVLHEVRLHEGRKDVFARNDAASGMRIVGADFGMEVQPPQGQAATPQAFLREMSFVHGELLNPQSFSTPNVNTGDVRGFFPLLTRVQGSNRLATIDGEAVTYNDRGSMETFPSWIQLPGSAVWERVGLTAEWDALGNLVRIERDDGVSISYVRDGKGRLVEREVEGPAGRCIPSHIRYFWGGGKLLEERDASQVSLPLVRRYHYLGDTPVLMEVSVGAGPMAELVPLVGLTGSIGGYLALDGALIHTIHYGLYGLPSAILNDDSGVVSVAHQSPIRFHGAFFDDASGLYEMGDRHLHPLTGGFLETDPEWFAESLAWFSAFNGDPAGRVDRDGRLSEQVDNLLYFMEQAGMAQSITEARKKSDVPLNPKVSSYHEKSGAGRAAMILWASFEDADLRKWLKSSTEAAGQFKDALSLLKETVEGMSPNESKPQSVYEMLKDPSSLLQIGDLSKDGMESGLLSLTANASVSAYRGGVELAPKVVSAYDDGMKKQMASYMRSKKLLKLGQVALKLWGEEALGDKHKTKVATQLLSTLSKGIDFAEQLTMQRGAREVVNLRTDPVTALKTSFNIGFEIGKLGVVIFADDDVSDAYLKLVKQFEDDGGWLTVGSGVLSTLGFDDAAFLIQRVQDLDPLSGVQEVLNSANEDRRRRQAETEFLLRGLSAP